MLAFRPDTVGADVNPHLVSYVRQRGHEAHLIENGHLPFADASFDGAILDNVLEHLDEPTQLLAEILRVLRPGASFVVGVPGRKGYASDADHKVFYDREAMRARIASAGFLPGPVFEMPLPLPMLDTRLSQYCLYGVFHVPS